MNADAPLSPHVHFPTPSALTSTFPVDSPGTYNRSAIVVSPTSTGLKMPGYGERVYSPTIDAFRNLEAERGYKSFSDIEVVQSPLPPITPAPSTPSILKKSGGPIEKPATRASLRFQQTLAKKEGKTDTLPRGVNVNEGLPRFPRSPYPSEPISPIPRRMQTRRMSSARNVLSPVAEVKSPLNTDMMSPVNEDQLAQDFWQAVRLDSASIPQPLSLGAPFALEAAPNTFAQAPAKVELMFGGRDGSIVGMNGKEPMRGLQDMRSPSFPISPYPFNHNASFGFGMPLSPLPRARLADVPNVSGLMSPSLASQFGLTSSTGNAILSPAVNETLPSFGAVLSALPGIPTNV